MNYSFEKQPGIKHLFGCFLNAIGYRSLFPVPSVVTFGNHLFQRYINPFYCLLKDLFKFMIALEMFLAAKQWRF